MPESLAAHTLSFSKVFDHCDDFGKHTFFYQEFTAGLVWTDVREYVGHEVKLCAFLEVHEHAEKVLHDGSFKLDVTVKPKDVTLTWLVHCQVCKENECQLDGLDEFGIRHLIDLDIIMKNCKAASTFFSCFLGNIPHQEFKNSSSSVELDRLFDKNLVLCQIGEHLQR